MSAGPLRPLRARSATEKSRRRDDILRAAERLWAHAGYGELSMNQVAREAQLAKGTLYLYFDTKEELFLVLLTEHLTEWFGELHTLLETHRPQQPRELSVLLMQSLKGKAQLRRLLLLLHTVLTRQRSPEATHNFRRELRQPYEQAIALLPYDEALNRQVLAHFYALATGWQQLIDDDGLSSATLGWEREGISSFEESMATALEAVIERLTQCPQTGQ